MENPSVTDFLQNIGTIADALQNDEACIVCALEGMRAIAVKFTADVAASRMLQGKPVTFDCQANANGDNLPFES